MKKVEIKDEKYQKLLKDIGAIIEKGRKEAKDTLKGIPCEVKDDIFKDVNNPPKKEKRRAPSL